jgi:hypothetical protein
MPHSWLRIPANTGQKVKDCMGSDHSKAKFEDCVGQVVTARNGSVDARILFEGNGRWAHVYVGYADDEQLNQIILDLEAERAVELFSAAEMDERIAFNDKTGYQAE